MADVPIWPGSGSYSEVTQSTPYSFYDSDTTFVSHSVQTAEWATKRLGYPIMEIELQGSQIYACFEEAVTEYSAIVNRFNIKDNIKKLQGAPTSSNFTHQLVNDLGRAITVSKAYGAEAGVGGNVDWKTGYVECSASKQVYDLNEWAIANESSNSIEIKRVFHEQTPAMTRFFDPYAGTNGSSMTNMLDSFGWSSVLSPAVTFTMMPMHEDLLQVQAIELNDQIRKSAYSFELINNKLRVFPTPTTSFKMYFQYIVEADRFKNFAVDGTEVTDSTVTMQTDFSNIRYDNMAYTNINDPGKQWIRKYTLALCKELLGMIRSKYGSVPIPAGEATLEGDTLRAEATAEKDALVLSLTEMLEMSMDNEIMEEEAQEAEHTMEILKKVPLKIYVG